MKLTLADVERCLGGIAEEGHQDTFINSVQTDSRTVEKGDLFFCIEGENFDGHEFAPQTARNGAAAIVTSRRIEGVNIPTIMVRNTTLALGHLAACWRNICGSKLVAVTGTAGKTTVKELLYTVVSQKFNTAKNFRNFNNQIGLPMSMLKANAEQEVWIMELGISIKGDMEELAPIACPDIVIITNIGPGHLAGLGDEAGVARAKTELLKHICPTGVGIVCKDYPLLWDAACEITGSPIGFSTKDFGAPYAASFIKAETHGRGRFRLLTPEGDGEFTAPFCGEHFAENLAGVAAAAHQLGISRDEVIAGVQGFTADCQRFCCKSLGSTLIIDDTYNANPLSMSRSIKTAVDLTQDRPLVLVLGDMRELGAEAVLRHEELGQLIATVKPTAVFYKGDHFADLRIGMGSDATLHQLTTPEDFIAQWNELTLEGAVILFKGSRSLKMETFSNALCKTLESATGAKGATL